MAERWVINASPVILLAKAGVIDLLAEACDEIVIPSSVVGEVARGHRSDEGRAWLGGNGARFIVTPPAIPAQLKEADLGLGETQVLAWAVATLNSRQCRMIARAVLGQRSSDCLSSARSVQSFFSSANT